MTTPDHTSELLKYINSTDELLSLLYDLDLLPEQCDPAVNPKDHNRMLLIAAFHHATHKAPNDPFL